MDVNGNIGSVTEVLLTEVASGHRRTVKLDSSKFDVLNSKQRLLSVSYMRILIWARIEVPGFFPRFLHPLLNYR